MHFNENYELPNPPEINKKSGITIPVHAEFDNETQKLFKELKKETNELKSSLMIKIKYHNPNLEKIKKIDIGDWIDLRAAEDVTFKAGEYKLISLGVSMELPKGYEAIVAPRSSIFKNFKVLLSNSIGIIDESYKGNNDVWKFGAYALQDTEIHFIEVDSLDNADRGGIGSTGTN